MQRIETGSEAADQITAKGLLDSVRMAAPSRSEEPTRPPLPWKFVYAIVGLVAFALYIPSLSGAPVWDDWQLLSGEGLGGGTVVGALTQPMMHGYFRPLANLWILGENNVFHGLTFYYHLANVGLLVCTCLLLVGLLRTVFGSRRISLIAGLAMAVQPTMVSALGWISGVTNLLGACAAAGCVWTLILSYKEPRKAAMWTAISATLFALCLFAKEQAIALVLLFPLARPAFLETPEPLRDYWKRLVPFAIATLFFLVTWKIYFPGYPNIDRTFVERVQMVGQSACYYALVLLFPTAKLLQTYTLAPFSHGAWTWTILGYALIFAFLWAWLKVQRANPKLGWFGAFLFLAILPVLNIAPPPSFDLAPYRVPMSVLPLAAVVGILGGRAKHTWVIALVAMMGCWWAVQAYLAIPAWSDERSLFSAIVAANPDFLLARRNLAYTYIHSTSGDMTANGKAAVLQLETTLDQVYGSRAWLNEGNAISLVKTDAAVRHRLDLNKGPSDGYKWLAGVYTQLSEARLEAGDRDAAITAAREATELNRIGS